MSQARNFKGSDSSFAARVLLISSERKGKEELHLCLGRGIAIGNVTGLIVLYVDTDIYDTSSIPREKFFISPEQKLAEFACYDQRDVRLLLEALKEKNPLVESDARKSSNLQMKSHFS